jgi:cell division ATPase FtsA
MYTEIFMTKTIKQVVKELTISLAPNTATPDTEFMTAISAITGDFSLVLQVSPNDVIRSTGMVTISSGIVTISDVGRVFEAATSLPFGDDVLMYTSPTCHFLVDGTIRTKVMPIGMPATRLDVTVALIRINDGMLQRWRDWASALGRNIVGWRIEEVLSH